MAITRAQQFRQMLEDGGMLVSPSTTGKRPGYRAADAQEAREKSRKEYSERSDLTQSQRDDKREEFKAQRKQATQRLKKKDPTRPATIFSDLINKGGLGLSFLRNLNLNSFLNIRQRIAIPLHVPHSKLLQLLCLLVLHLLHHLSYGHTKPSNQWPPILPQLPQPFPINLVLLGSFNSSRTP